jgi:hypothetical protein
VQADIILLLLEASLRSSSATHVFGYCFHWLAISKSPQWKDAGRRYHNPASSPFLPRLCRGNTYTLILHVAISCSRHGSPSPLIFTSYDRRLDTSSNPLSITLGTDSIDRKTLLLVLQKALEVVQSQTMRSAYTFGFVLYACSVITGVYAEYTQHVNVL